MELPRHIMLTPFSLAGWITFFVHAFPDPGRWLHLAVTIG